MRRAEHQLLPTCARLGLGFFPYFPLANGLLTGKYRRGRAAREGTRLQGRQIADEQYARIEALEGFARERGRSLLEVAIAGLAAQPPIVGGRRRDEARAGTRTRRRGSGSRHQLDLTALRSFG